MKAQPQARVAQLKAQFPVIDEYLRLGSWHWPHDTSTDKIHIQVQRADENSLMRQPMLIDGVSALRFDSTLAHEDMASTVHEVWSAVGAEHNILSTVGYWPTGSERIAGTLPRVKQLVDSQADKVSYLVGMVITSWHRYIKDYIERGLDSPLSFFVEREIHITIRRPPKSGFSDLLARVDVTKNIRLNVTDMATAACRDDQTYDEVQRQLDDLVGLFVSRVYRQGLRQVIDASTKKGMSGTFGSTNLMSYVMAGRVMFTFRKGNDSVSFLGAEGEDDPRMELNSISATLPGARAMVEQVVQEWENSPLPQNERFKDDTDVSLGF